MPACHQRDSHGVRDRAKFSDQISSSRKSDSAAMTRRTTPPQTRTARLMSWTFFVCLDSMPASSSISSIGVASKPDVLAIWGGSSFALLAVARPLRVGAEAGFWHRGAAARGSA